MRILFLFWLFVFLVFSTALFAQQPQNTDPNHNYVNVNFPSTPESAAFEKYGNYEVDEFTGTVNVNIPIYTIKSKFLSAPIALSYRPTGIKVNQEASWVGLGFDLNAGGRITVETRGGNDVHAAYADEDVAGGMQKIFNRLGNSREVGVLTWASICESCPSSYTIPDPWQAVEDMTYYGAGEPDIYRANFMGHSFSFFFDKITGNLTPLGEQSTFKISFTKPLKAITDWTISDNDGIKYYFTQTETTTLSLRNNPADPETATSAWLLTKVVHPSGDYIRFTYNNYGNSIPAFTMSGSIDYTEPDGTPDGGILTIPGGQEQSVAILSPCYLTEIETDDVAVDFDLDTRSDIYGPGSRKLNKITVTDKASHQIIKSATFTYSYFTASSKPCTSYLTHLVYSLPPSLNEGEYIACSDKRLRLDQLAINSSTYQPPYEFSYYVEFIPDKYSMSQDHWGYYDGVVNDSRCEFTRLIPEEGLGTSADYIPLNPGVLGPARNCDATSMTTMSLQKIVYPTGGSTEFVYEPHQSIITGSANVTGGGLRIKAIKNYNATLLTGSTEYQYKTGKYMGNISYSRRALTLKVCTTDGHINQHKLTSSGAINDNDILVGYPKITITQKNSTGQTNGYLVKIFNCDNSAAAYAGNYGLVVGFDAEAAQYPTGETSELPSPFGFAPTPTNDLEGKLVEEKYYDNDNDPLNTASVPLKSIKYNYRLANYKNNFYSIRAI